MSKNKRNFLEQKLFDRFHHDELSPADSIWQNIQTGLDHKKEDRKRPFIFIYFFIFLISTGFLSYFVFNHNVLFANNKSTVAGSKIAFGDKKIINDPENKIDEIKEIQSGIVKSNSSTIISEENISQAAKNSAFDQNKISDNIGFKKNSVRNNDFKRTGIKKDVVTKNNRKKSKDSDNIKAESIFDNISNSSDINSSISSDFSSTDNLQNENNVHLDSKIAASTDLNTQSGSFNIFDKLTSRSIFLPEVSLTEFDELILNSERNKIKKERALRNYFTFSGGVGMPIRKLNSKKSETGLYRERNKTETPYYATNFSTSIGVIANKQWTISSGLEFVNVVEKFYYSKDDATVILKKYDPSDNVYYDSLATGRMIEGSKNKFTMFNLPIDLGYEKRLGKWKVGIEAGIGLNLYFNSSGKILYADQNVQRLEDIDNIYKTNIGLQFRFSCSLNRNLDNKTSVFFKPQFISYLEQWNQTSHPYDISYDLVNLNIGFRRLF